MNRIPLSSADRFLIRDRYAFLCDIRGNSREIHILDLENPEKPRLVNALSFRNPIGCLSIDGNVLLAGENGRALHRFDLDDPANPKPLDVYVLLGYDLHDICGVSGKVLAAMKWEGIGMVDLDRPNEIQPIEKNKLDGGLFERLTPFRDRFLTVSARSDNRFLYEISLSNGLMEIIDRKEFRNFKPTSVFSANSEIVLYGENESGDGEHPSVLFFYSAFQRLGEPVRLAHRPRICFPLSDGNILFGFDSSYALWDRNGHKITPLFRQFEDRISKEYSEIPIGSSQRYGEDGDDSENRDCIPNEASDMEFRSACKKGDFLFATHDSQFLSFRIAADSVFRKIV
ncbi:hypothetical protein [Leptospira ellisii]|uniref:hypothetical protein n=1 Tax=Leptospira ellisii TaxID=2023197 RepID=UPI000C299513|nr:hypothetical protein [Leptospira ellisii]PKA05733.1 hypothetical protein CH375_03545 [Leptospira ellisii]